MSVNDRPVVTCWLISAVLALTLVALPRAAAADGAWLEKSGSDWNKPGMPIPTADPGMMTAVDPRCAQQERPPETAEDLQLAGAGWKLVGSFQAGWGIRVVQATAAYDGMCRPTEFNTFVFKDGVFAGTISPTPMAARSDGSGRVISFFGPAALIATYARYAPTDPLCCPSGNASVTFAVQDQPGGPVLVRTSPPGQ